MKGIPLLFLIICQKGVALFHNLYTYSLNFNCIHPKESNHFASF